MTWVAVAVGGASLVGSVLSSNASKSAANSAASAQESAAAQANALQEKIYNQNVGYETPYMNTGTAANSALSGLLGLGGKAPDYSQFLNSPGYQFQLQQGMANLDKSAAARGNLYSGGYGQQLVGYNQGMAQTGYNNYFNQLSGVAGRGQGAAAALSGVGENYAAAVGQNLSSAGTAAANGFLANGQANANMYGQLGQIAGNAYNQFNQSSYGPNQQPNYSYLNSSNYTGGGGAMTYPGLGAGGTGVGG